MISSRQKRVVRLGALAALAAAVLAGSALSACTSNFNAPPADPDGGQTDGSVDGSTSEDSSLPELDGGVDAPADAPKDANNRDANGPATLGEVCSFNWDCQTGLRCECNEVDGCGCKAGARGTGRNGIDPCTTGDTCASAVCTEGPPGTGSFCSDECASAADCVGKLPRCLSVAFVGTICVRSPPM